MSDNCDELVGRSADTDSSVSKEGEDQNITNQQTASAVKENTLPPWRSPERRSGFISYELLKSDSQPEDSDEQEKKPRGTRPREIRGRRRRRRISSESDNEGPVSFQIGSAPLSNIVAKDTKNEEDKQKLTALTQHAVVDFSSEISSTTSTKTESTCNLDVLRTDSLTSKDDDSSEITSPTSSTSNSSDLTETLQDPSGVANGTIPRPVSLSLPKPLQYYEKQRQQPGLTQEKTLTSSDLEEIEQAVESTEESEPLLSDVTSTPLQQQGTVMQEGDMISFVAEDLQEKIKMSSPMSIKGSGSRGSGTPSSRSLSSLNSFASSTSMSTSWSTSVSGMSRSPSLLQQSPDDMPPIDPRAILDLEIHARRVADSVDLMLGNLKTILGKMSVSTVECVKVYQASIDSTCESVDASIKSMYALMAKAEELSSQMRPVYKIADQTKEIKRLLDLFEAQLAREEK